MVYYGKGVESGSESFKMCETLNLFFEAMADRLNNENDLSDITYALCKSDDEFRKFFLEYCFEESINTDDLIREYADGSSRPDFYFIDRQNNERLIEVKINDRNQHFAQYNRQFPNAKYAYISNYVINMEELSEDDKKAFSRWKIKTWFDFYKKLSKATVKENELVIGYLYYLKKVINIREFKKMDIRKTGSLPDFISNLIKIVSDKGYYEYNGAKSINEDYFGKFFCKDNFYFWFGLYLHDEKIYIGLKNDEYWITQKIKDNLKKKFKGIEETEFFEKPIEVPDGNFGDFWFSLKKDKYDILCDESQEYKQLEVLEGFFNTVMKTIGVEI